MKVILFQSEHIMSPITPKIMSITLNVKAESTTMVQIFQ